MPSRQIYGGKGEKSWGNDLPAANGDNIFELPLPATYVVDRQSHIALGFVDADYTKRSVKTTQQPLVFLSLHFLNSFVEADFRLAILLLPLQFRQMGFIYERC